MGHDERQPECVAVSPLPGADVLVGYSDASWSVGHSTTGYTIEIANASVCYASKRQHCVALSSTEAETSTVVANAPAPESVVQVV